MEWSDIKVFLQVARSGQMAAASRLLDMDHSTISRRISRLETDTGVALFDRAGRRLSLTEEGSKLLAAAEKLEAIIVRDVQSLGEGRGDVAGRVRIGTTEGFGSHYLARRLPLILADHPGLELELLAMQRSYSLGMREVDIVVSVDRPDKGEIRMRRLCEAGLGVYAARGFFEGRPLPRSVGDLRGYLWCGYVGELLFTEELDLLAFEDVTIVPRYRTTSVTVQLGAALSGKALVVLPTYMALQHPALEMVPLEGPKVGLTYWMSVHNDQAKSPRVRAVMESLEKLVRGDGHLFPPFR